MSNWYEGVYELDPWGVIGGGTVHRDFYGFYPTNPTQSDPSSMFFLPQIPGGGGGNAPGAGIGINIPFPGGGTGQPSANQQMTTIVNDYERRLQINLGEYQSGQRSAANAVENGWNLMNAVVVALRAYGVAGERSAAERDRRINPSLLKWDWIAYYIDPIVGGPSTPQPLPSGGATPLPGGGALPPSGGFPPSFNNPVGDLFNNPAVLLMAGLLLIVLAMKK